MGEQGLLHVRGERPREPLIVAQDLQNLKSESPSVFGMGAIPKPVKDALGRT
jgi:hypothetical protein